MSKKKSLKSRLPLKEAIPPLYTIGNTLNADEEESLCHSLKMQTGRPLKRVYGPVPMAFE